MKSRRSLKKYVFISAFFLILAIPALSYAYIGPGAGFALVSSFLSFVIAFFAAFFALLTFPLRMLVRKVRRKKIPGNPRVKKVIILGLDGLDPDICERLMSSGDLPNFSRLKSEGSFRRLGTSVPAMSPVAWSTFSTGVDASRHAIFDFLARDPRNYAPVLSSSSVSASRKSLKLWRFRIPLGKSSVRFLRKSRSFWKVLSDYGVFSIVLRVPITFPPEKFNGVMLSGMCVPDLRGTMGSFTYFCERESDEKIGGMIVTLKKNGGTLSASLPGPESPVSDGTLELPLEIRVEKEKRGALIKISGQQFFLHERGYSPWIRLTFKAAPGIKFHGIARFYITRIDPDFGLYVSPIHIDPDKPAMPISYPSFYSMYLAKRQGPFGTLGLAEDTWAVNEKVLDDEAFIRQAYLFHRERETMFIDSLKKLNRGLITCVFDLSDRIQHMFFRYLVDESGPRDETLKHREVLYDMYREMDKLLGRTMAFVNEKTALFVISDHGFKAFKRGVDLNAWLKKHGYLTLKTDTKGDEYLRDVDWAATKAYALGLGGMYINRKGRERHGIVSVSEADALKEEIKSKLMTLAEESDGKRVVGRIYDTAKDFTGPYRAEGPDLIVGLMEGFRISWDCARGKVTDKTIENNEKSWSGDHCIDPKAVPGILFSNLKVSEAAPNIVDMAPTILKLFGIEPPKYMTGKDIL
ncbi:MAG: alkaline phosphatase family protein [Candidatus Eisenbacteria bacterium]|nr:alkaline phosphatase family protein [Candidatus Eisenbacteria bacterium]